MTTLAEISVVPVRPRCKEPMADEEEITVTNVFLAALRRGWTRDEATRESVTLPQNSNGPSVS